MKSDEIVGVTAFARECGVSRSYMRTLVSSGKIPSTPDGIPLAEGLAAWRELKGDREDADFEQRAGETVTQKTARAKLAKETYAAQLKKLEVQQKKGELMEVAAAARFAGEVMEAFVTKLRGIAPRIAMLCENRTAREIESIIEEEHENALDELRKMKFK